MEIMSWDGGSIKLLFLVIQEELREWEQCLQMLGDAKVDDHGNVSNTKGGNVMYLDKDSHDREINISAAICFLRGRAYEALENRAQARQWYIAAVKADPLCYEALEHLIEIICLHAMKRKKSSLLSSLQFCPEEGWLSSFYTCLIKKQDKENVVEAKFNDLEKENASSTTSDLSFTGTLKNNTDLLSCKAEYYHQCGEYQKCFELTSLLLEKDPFHLKCTLVHLAAAMELGQSNELYLMACNLSRLSSKLFFMSLCCMATSCSVSDFADMDAYWPLSWFAVGCYYYCIRKYDQSRRYFRECIPVATTFKLILKGIGIYNSLCVYVCVCVSACQKVTKLLSSTLFVYPLYSKATSLEGTFLSAWIGQGNAYAALEEGDQAMLAYRTAARLFPGCHLPTMYIGMEYMRTHSFKLAEQGTNPSSLANVLKRESIPVATTFKLILKGIGIYNSLCVYVCVCVSACQKVTKLLSSTLFVYPLYSKATSLEGTFLSAWIGQGNAYAALEEGDQAMLAYRTAARLFPGCHLPTMYIGMEYMRTHSFKLAEQFFLQAKTICCSDPLVYNELGVVAYHMKE
ncbi:Anaphase-promoting complex subunit 6 [Bienertia sinuspersici]